MFTYVSIYHYSSDIYSSKFSNTEHSSTGGIKRRQFFCSRLSKHVRRGNFVRSSYYSVQFLYFAVYFSPIFSRIGYHLKAKLLELGKKQFFVGTFPYKSSTHPLPLGTSSLSEYVMFRLVCVLANILSTYFLVLSIIKDGIFRMTSSTVKDKLNTSIEHVSGWPL